MSPGSKRQSPHSSSGTIPRMPSTISFSQGDVVLVPFPFTDLTAIKQRPALVLSPERFNNVRADLAVAALTSQIPGALGDDEVFCRMLISERVDCRKAQSLSSAKFSRFIKV